MSPEMQKAMQACASLRPNGGGGGAFGGRGSSAMQAFTACLKTHGVVLPAGRGQSPSAGATPAPSGGARPSGGAARGLRGLQTSDPKVAAALKTCRPLMPTGAPAPNPS
jgi:hypothetical protein